MSANYTSKFGFKLELEADKVVSHINVLKDILERSHPTINDAEKFRIIISDVFGLTGTQFNGFVRGQLGNDSITNVASKVLGDLIDTVLKGSAKAMARSRFITLQNTEACHCNSANLSEIGKMPEFNYLPHLMNNSRKFLNSAELVLIVLIGDDDVYTE